MKDNRKKRKRFLPIWFLLIALLIGGCGSETESRQTDAIMQQTLTETADTLEETQEQRAVVASDETESAAKTQEDNGLCDGKKFSAYHGGDPGLCGCTVCGDR